MTRRTLCLRVAACLAASLWLVSSPSKADATKDQCVDANTKGQDLRRAGKLSAARDQLRQCASPTCPAMVRDDCTKRLDEVENAQPAIVFDAKDGSGRDVSIVKVTVDGRPLAEKLDGTALQVDPGEHAFVFTVPGQTPVTETLVVKEGDKERRERVVIGALVMTSPPSSEPQSAAPPPESPASSGMGAQRVVGLVTGVIGVAGIAVGSVYAVMAASEGNKQQTDCPSTGCNTIQRIAAMSDHATGEMDRTISIVGFAASGALLLGGTILFLTGGHPSKASAGTGMLLLPTLGPAGGGMLLEGKF